MVTTEGAPMQDRRAGRGICEQPGASIGWTEDSVQCMVKSIG